MKQDYDLQMHSARHAHILLLQLPVLCLPRLTGNDGTSLSWQCHIIREPWSWTMGRSTGVNYCRWLQWWIVINLTARVIYWCYVQKTASSLFICLVQRSSLVLDLHLKMTGNKSTLNSKSGTSLVWFQRVWQSFIELPNNQTQELKDRKWRYPFRRNNGHMTTEYKKHGKQDLCFWFWLFEPVNDQLWKLKDYSRRFTFQIIPGLCMLTPLTYRYHIGL